MIKKEKKEKILLFIHKFLLFKKLYRKEIVIVYLTLDIYGEILIRNFVNTRLLCTNINKDYLVGNIVGIFNIYPIRRLFYYYFHTVNNFHSLFYRGNGK